MFMPETYPLCLRVLGAINNKYLMGITWHGLVNILQTLGLYRQIGCRPHSVAP